MTDLPSGTVTFLFTDIERSTQTVGEIGDERYADLQDEHRRLLRGAFAAHNGVEVGTEGDALFVAFARAHDAIAAAVDGQRALSEGSELSVRMGIHTGEALVRDGNYVGHDVHKAKRISDAGHGGQILVSQASAELVRDAADLIDLGPHRLKDLASPERIFQAGGGEFPTLRSLDAFRTNLPIQRSSFVGRAAEIAEVRKLLEANRLVTLTGVGGCGKTRLALQVAAEELDRFSDGAFFTELAPISDPELMPRTIAGALGLRFGGFGEGGDVGQIVLAHLERLDCLLVLDNCEHLLDACADLVDEILGRCPGVAVLATSREGLDVEGEQSYTVPSLSVPKEDADVGTSEAVSLFKARATSAQPQFELTPANVGDVAEICRRLDGIPLAIELAASRVTHLSLRQIADRLDDLFGELTGGRRRVQRQQTLQATLDWSYELLDEPERALLARLAVFSGDFTLEAVEGVCAGEDVDPGRVVALVASLVSKSLVVADPTDDTVRYRLLEPVRLYASEKLRARGEGETLRTGHRDWFLWWLEVFPPVDAAWNSEVVTTLERDLDNLRAAIEWSFRQDRPDLAARLATHSYGLVSMRGHHDEFHRWLLRAVEQPDRLDAEPLALCFGYLGMISMLRFDGATIGYAKRALAIDLEDPSRVRSSAVPVLALGLVMAGADEARVFIERALEDVEELVTDWRGSIQVYVGWTELMLLDIPKACGLFRSAIEVAEPRFTTIHLHARTSLAVGLHLMGDDGGAHEAARSALGIARTLLPDDLPLLDVLCMAEATPALAAGGDVAEARSFLNVQLREISRLAALPMLVNSILVCCAAVEAIDDRYDRASRLLSAALPAGMPGRQAQQAQERPRSPCTWALYTHYVPLVRQRIGPDEARRLRDEGRKMSLDEAVAYALEDLEA